MKVRIEVDPSLTEDEVVIRCRRVEEHILRLSQEASESGEEKSCMALRIGETSYYVPLKEILFFETEGKSVRAHTAEKMYEADHKLYQLEESLPGYFCLLYTSPSPRD